MFYIDFKSRYVYYTMEEQVEDWLDSKPIVGVISYFDYEFIVYSMDLMGLTFKVKQFFGEEYDIVCTKHDLKHMQSFVFNGFTEEEMINSLDKMCQFKGIIEQSEAREPTIDNDAFRVSPLIDFFCSEELVVKMGSLLHLRDLFPNMSMLSDSDKDSAINSDAVVLHNFVSHNVKDDTGVQSDIDFMEIFTETDLPMYDGEIDNFFTQNSPIYLSDMD